MDFAKCRNILIENSTYDWIFYIDADEYLDYNSKCIKNFIALFDNFKYTPLTISPKIVLHDNNEIFLTQRIFNKTHNLRFYGSIHEYLKLPNNNSGSKYYIMTNFIVYHDGYKPEIIKNKNKLERNLTLLNDMIKKDSKNMRWYYYLGREMFLNNGDLVKITNILNDGLHISDEDSPTFKLPILVLLCEIYYSSGQIDKLELTSNEIKENFKNSADYYYFYQRMNYSKQLYNILKLNTDTILNLKKIEFSQSLLHSQNYHILKHLGLSYVTIENYDLSFKLLSQIKYKEYLSQAIQMLLNKKNNIENLIEKLSV